MSSSLSLSKLRRRPENNTKNHQRHQKLHETRFDGLTELQIQQFSLPDYLQPNLDVIFIGINPGLISAHRKKYYAGPGNHFYKLLHFSGFTPTILSSEEDYKLLNHGIGLTNIVQRPTRSSSELKLAEIKSGISTIVEKIHFYRPKIAVFNGKCIYQVFSSCQSNEFKFGLQLKMIGETRIWVTPSTSARCANFPRMIDKLHFFQALRKYLQCLDNEVDVNLEQFRFEGKCKMFLAQTSKMWRRKKASKFLSGGRIANKKTLVGEESFNEDVAAVCCKEFMVLRRESLDIDGRLIENWKSLDNDGNIGESLDNECIEKKLDTYGNIGKSLDKVEDIGKSMDNYFEDYKKLRNETSLDNFGNLLGFESLDKRKSVENLDNCGNIGEKLDNFENSPNFQTLDKRKTKKILDGDKISKTTKNKNTTKNKRKTLDDYGKISKFRMEKSNSSKPTKTNPESSENFEFVDLIKRRLLERQENVEISCNLKLKAKKTREKLDL